MDDLKIIEITCDGDIAFVSFLVPSVSAVGDVEVMGKALRGFIAENRPQKIVVDFSGLKFFSSQVLGLLVEAWKRLKEYEGSVVISGINPDLSRVFKITNLDSLFDFYPDKESAVKALSVRLG
jgi:anti-sigma B factor antagonist